MKLCLRTVSGRLVPLVADEATGSGIAKSSICRDALPTFWIVSVQTTACSSIVYCTRSSKTGIGVARVFAGPVFEPGGV